MPTLRLVELLGLPAGRVGPPLALRPSMARPLRLHIRGMTYHVMSRGNARLPVFLDDRDYERYLELLERCLRRFGVRCVGYCLLINHVHLILQAGDLPISRMMQQLNSTYAQWFNRRHGRVGHVFQGRFKALLVETPAYLTKLLRYVLWNPVAAGCVGSPGEWRWSSYLATTGLGPGPTFVCVEEVWGELNAPDAEVGRLLFADSMKAAPGPDMSARALVVGSCQFAERFGPLLRPHRRTRDYVRSERFADRPPLAELFGGSPDRNELAFLARRAFLEHGYTLREIGGALRRAPATIWFWVHRVAGAHAPHSR